MTSTESDKEVSCSMPSPECSEVQLGEIYGSEMHMLLGQALSFGLGQIRQ